MVSARDSFAFRSNLIIAIIIFPYCSNETPRDPGEAWFDAHTRPQLVRPAIMCNERRWIVRRPHLAHEQPEVMRLNQSSNSSFNVAWLRLELFIFH